jgi:peptide/nickel transport system permease protein
VTAYVIRRILWGILLLVIVCALTFLFFRVIPTGNPAVLRAGRDPQPKLIKEIEATLGLNKSLPTQFWDYLKGIFLHFNFGYSYYSQESVVGLIKERLPATISLTVGAAVLWVIGGMAVGIISAIKRHTLIDRISMGGALVAVSAPSFWLGLLALLLFANDIGKFKILPGAGTYTGLTYDPWKWFTSLIMPWLVLAASSAAIFARLMRGNLLEVMDEDYIRTARAKGLPERKVLRQGVRSSINPFLTLLGLEIGILLGGAVLVETVFNIPGL